MNKKLLIFHPTIAPYRIDFFNELFQNFKTKVCLQYWNLKDQNFDYDKIYNQFVFNPVYLPNGSIWNVCKSVLKQITCFNPDVIFTCEYGLITILSLLYVFFCRKKTKLVVMTDDSFDMVENGNDFTYRHRIARNIIAHYIDNFIVVEPRVEQWYKQHYGTGLFFPIVTDERKAIEKYERLLPYSREIACRYNIIGKKVLLSVNRLVELKNLHRLLEAFSISQTEATLIIIGDGPERDSLVEHANRINRNIVFVGRLEGDALYAWYNIASVFVLASYQEAFGAVTNEALQAGCRVIVSKNAGSSCLVTDENGQIVDPMNVEEMAKAIDRQLNIISVPDLKKIRKNLSPVSFKERVLQDLV